MKIQIIKKLNKRIEELEKLSNTTRGLTQFVNRMWEKSQSGKKVRSIVKNACINSEGVIHFYNEGEEIKTHLKKVYETMKGSIVREATDAESF